MSTQVFMAKALPGGGEWNFHRTRQVSFAATQHLAGFPEPKAEQAAHVASNS